MTNQSRKVVIRVGFSFSYLFFFFFPNCGGLTCCGGLSVVTVIRLRGTGVVHRFPVIIRTFFFEFSSFLKDRKGNAIKQSRWFQLIAMGSLSCCRTVRVRCRCCCCFRCFNFEDFTYLIVERSGHEQRPSVGLLLSAFCSVVWVSFFVVFVFVVVFSFIFVVGQ